MRTVLVAGGAGYIGCNLVKRLLNLGYVVRVVDKQLPIIPLYEPHQVQFIQADLAHPGLIEEALEGVDVCFHLANTSYAALCHHEWIASQEADFHVFNSLLDAIRRMDRKVKLVYTSSAEVYNDVISTPHHETERLQPITFEGGNALHLETQAFLAQVNFNNSAIGLRIFNVYGPGFECLSHDSVFISFWQSIQSKKPLLVYGSGEAERDFIYIDDVIDALMQAALFTDMDSGMFNVCTGVGTSINRLAYLMLALMEVSLPIVHVKEKETELLHKVGCPDLAKKILGFQSKIGLEEGLVTWLLNYQELINE